MLFAIGGWLSVAYLLASQAFFTGFLHPYCLGWVLGISHFHGARSYQPTASHYGWLVNLLSFNAGLHVEHHDLMTIPWRRLPSLRQMAPEYLRQPGADSLLHLAGPAIRLSLARRFFEANFNHEAHRNRARSPRARKPLLPAIRHVKMAALPLLPADTSCRKTCP